MKHGFDEWAHRVGVVFNSQPLVVLHWCWPPGAGVRPVQHLHEWPGGGGDARRPH